jgi:hypothetical protein
MNVVYDTKTSRYMFFRDKIAVYCNYIENTNTMCGNTQNFLTLQQLRHVKTQRALSGLAHALNRIYRRYKSDSMAVPQFIASYLPKRTVTICKKH